MSQRTVHGTEKLSNRHPRASKNPTSTLQPLPQPTNPPPTTHHPPTNNAPPNLHNPDPHPLPLPPLPLLPPPNLPHHNRRPEPRLHLLRSNASRTSPLFPPLSLPPSFPFTPFSPANPPPPSPTPLPPLTPPPAQPHPDPSLSTPTTTTALLSALLFLSSLTDLTALSLPPEAAAQHWGAQAPVRLLFFFGVLGYVYLFKEGGVFGAATAGKGGKGWGAELRNGVVFTWAFLEMMGWFWVSGFSFFGCWWWWLWGGAVRCCGWMGG